MKRSLTFLVLIFATMCAYAAEGDFFYLDRVQYQVKKSDAQQNLYTVAIVRYDTSCVIVPDSVPYNGQKYQVVQIPDFRSGSYLVQHYTKVDFSQIQNTFTNCSFKTASSIEVDTLILPPNCSSYSVTYYKTTNTGSIPQGGVHRIFCTGPSMPQGNKPFGVELWELDMNSSTCTTLPFTFSNCSQLKKLILPSTLTLFPENLLEGDTLLTELSIPSGLETIKQNAFDNHRLEVLQLDANVHTLQPGFCSKWYRLHRIDVSPVNAHYMSDEEGVLFTKNKGALVRYPVGKEEEVYFIPAGVDTISSQSFSLQTLQRNYYEYDEFADNPFYYSDKWTFSSLLPYQHSAPLHMVGFHPNVSVIDRDAFMFASIRLLAGGEDPKAEQDFSFSNVQYIKTGAFVASMLEEVNLPSSLVALGSVDGSYLFFWNEYDSQAPISETNIFMKDYNWEQLWDLEDKYLGNHYTVQRGGWVFAHCKHLHKVDFSQAHQLSYLGYGTFFNCPNLDTLNLAPCDKLHHIQISLCDGDSALKYVHLPYYVDTIDYCAFQNCVSLQKIVCPAPVPIPIHHSVFDGVNTHTCELSVPAASIHLYRNAPIWRNFHTITANGLLALMVTTNDPRMGKAHGGAGLHRGQTATISATPRIGYEFIGWSDGVTANPRTVTVTRDSSIVAIFQPIEYLIDAHSNDTTLGTVSGAGYYHLNDTVILSVNILEDARFTGWSDGFRYPVRDLVVTRDCTLIANFEHYHIGPDAVHVTVQSEDPSKGTTVGSGTYPFGDTASVAGIANAGYVFKGWDDGNINNPRHVPLTQDTLFIALFRLATDTADTMATPRYHLKAIPYDSTMGSVSGSGRYEEGTEVEITATPFEGYRITGWNIELTVEPTLIFTMPDRPVTIIAYFEPIDDALPATPADPNDPDASAPSYNILGQPVDDTYRGIVIRNGKKMLQ